MVRKKLDGRIKTVIENCVAAKHRALFVVVGDRGRDQVSFVLNLCFFTEILLKNRFADNN